MDFLINPNVSYVLLILGFLTAVLALFSPGTGVLEIFALFTIALAGYGIVNQPVNVWALAIMAVGFVPFFIALRQSKRQPQRILNLLLGGSVLAFVLGSALLFPWRGWQPAVNPVLILLFSIIAIGLTWLLATKMFEAITSRPAFDLDRLVGMTGQASSDIRGQGTVYVNGEDWSATSRAFIPQGSTVRVLRRDGLTLEVEKIK